MKSYRLYPAFSSPFHCLPFWLRLDESYSRQTYLKFYLLEQIEQLHDHFSEKAINTHYLMKVHWSPKCFFDIVTAAI